MPSLFYSFARQEPCFQVRRRQEPYAELESALHATVNGNFLLFMNNPKHFTCRNIIVYSSTKNTIPYFVNLR